MEQYVQKLFHVCITVEDIEAALAFYCGVLGMHSIGSLRHEKADGKLLGHEGEIEIHAEHLCGSIEEGATVIDLVQYLNPKAEISDTSKGLNRTGITRMAFGVDKIDDIYEKLSQRGDIEFYCKPMKLNKPGGGWLKVVTFKDPFGVVLELIESGE